MVENLWVTYFILTSHKILSMLADDCAYEMCICKQTIISCQKMSLTTIPELSTTYHYDYLQSLFFNDNQITSIPGETLPRNLSSLALTNNPISTVDDNAFDGSADTLYSIEFTFAQSSRVPDALLHVKHLRGLSVHNTKNLDWNLEVMKYLSSSLQQLIIDNVTLPTWPSWISNFVHLTELEIVNCLLYSIPDGALDVMANNLTTLTLTGNSFTVVPNSLYKLSGLQILYLDDNKLTDTTWLPQSSKLWSLNLNNNKIFNATQLSQSLSPYAECLTDVDITNNQLKSFPDLHFLSNPTLDLSNNMISDLNAGFLPPDLIMLNLEHNFLSLIPAAIANLSMLTDLSLPVNVIRAVEGTSIPISLTYLDLQNNLITELTESSFPVNSSLQSLNLNSNPIMKLSSLAFQNVNNLQDINLGQTKLTRLPLALLSLKRLNSLDVSGISGLICTCLEKNVGPLIASIESVMVQGNCGEITVHDFFSILGPSCPA